MVTEVMHSVEDPPAVQAETQRIEKILDTKYEPADLKQVTKDIPDLSKEDRS